MPLHPYEYAELLAKRIRRHGSKVWLVNTGWTGGPYGTGSRMKLSHTRRMLSEAIAGNLDDMSFRQERYFGLWIPDRVDHVPSTILNPRDTWSDDDQYDRKARELAGMFKANFTKFNSIAPQWILEAGPLV
jgi:phosphoenolpyruvate carboxykinase (ATP)